MQERTSFDITALIGAIGGFGAILTGYVLEHGRLEALVAQLSPFIIILGGTFMATLLHVRWATFSKMGAYFRVLMQEKQGSGAEIVEVFERLAERARREGLLSLESEAESLPDPFLRKGIQLVVDGTEPDAIRTVMEIEMEQRNSRHRAGIDMFEQMGGYSPTMGIIGTVMGLIVVLARLGEGGDLGGGIATAFLATLFGVSLANLLWLPIGGKLKAKNEAEQEHLNMMLEGILAIQQGENPRTVANRLEGFLSPAERARREAEPGRETVPAT